MVIKFKDQEHRNFFREMVALDKCAGDSYREALFYTLGINAETRNRVCDVYDFKEHGIAPEGLNKGWQASGSRRITLLAFNLYNGFTEDGREELSSPYHVFDCIDAPFMLEAVRVRFRV